MKRLKKPNIRSSYRITAKVTYEVLFIDSFPDPTVLGEMRPQTKQIVLKNGQSSTELIKSAIHELMHGIDAENNIGLTENQVIKLEHGIYKFLRLNEFI